jgi:hypothetical protein
VSIHGTLSTVQSPPSHLGHSSSRLVWTISSSHLISFTSSLLYTTHQQHHHSPTKTGAYNQSTTSLLPATPAASSSQSALSPLPVLQRQRAPTPWARHSLETSMCVQLSLSPSYTHVLDWKADLCSSRRTSAATRPCPSAMYVPPPPIDSLFECAGLIHRETALPRLQLC